MSEGTQYHVFLVTGDHLSGPHRSSRVAEEKAEKLRKNCPCKGDPECGTDEYGSHGIRVSRSVDGYWDNSY
jgi:hypothetical protein